MSSEKYQPLWNAALVLADGTIFRGMSFGADRNASAPITFTTRMFGYQEACTDAEFTGQILCMTYPVIGSYGVNPDDDAEGPHEIAGMVVREAADYTSNWRSRGTLDAYLKSRDIPGITDVDTRALTRHIRGTESIRATIVTDAANMTDAELRTAGETNANG